MKSLGLSPTEQEVVDMQCEVEKKGRIFFPDFCKLCLRKFREFDEENFKQELFKVSPEQQFHVRFNYHRQFLSEFKSTKVFVYLSTQLSRYMHKIRYQVKIIYLIPGFMWNRIPPSKVQSKEVQGSGKVLQLGGFPAHDDTLPEPVADRDIRNMFT